MFRNIIIAAVAVFALSQQASAGPKEDIEVIVDHVANKGTFVRANERIAKSYVNVYKGLLAENSSTILDRGRFAQMLVAHFGAGWENTMRQSFTATCFSRFSPAELRYTVDNLPKTMADTAALLNDRNDTARRVLGMSGYCFSKVAAALIRGPKEHNATLPAEAGDILTEILLTEGIIYFPNRIERRKAIQQLRKPAS
ncbi:MAG: hypothetical protein ACSHWS_17085 [Sulfitobacter sp.]